MSEVLKARVHLPILNDGVKYLDYCRGSFLILLEGEGDPRVSDLNLEVGEHSLRVRYSEDFTVDWEGIPIVVNSDGTLDFCHYRDGPNLNSGRAVRLVDNNGTILCGLAVNDRIRKHLLEVFAQLLMSSGRFYDEKIPRLRILPGPCVPHWGQSELYKLLHAIEESGREEFFELSGSDYTDEDDEPRTEGYDEDGD